MSSILQEKDWWTLFIQMSKAKLKQRHNQAVEKYPAKIRDHFYI